MAELSPLRKNDFQIKMRHFKNISFFQIKSDINRYFAVYQNADGKECWQSCVKRVIKENREALIVTDLCVNNLWRLGTIISNLLNLAKHVDDKGKVLLSRVFRRHLRMPLLNILRLWLRVDDEQDSAQYYAEQLKEAGTGGKARSADTVYINIATIVSMLSNFEDKHFHKPVPKFSSCLELIEKYKKDWCTANGSFSLGSRLTGTAEEHNSMELSPMKPGSGSKNQVPDSPITVMAGLP